VGTNEPAPSPLLDPADFITATAASNVDESVRPIHVAAPHHLDRHWPSTDITDTTAMEFLHRASLLPPADRPQESSIVTAASKKLDLLCLRYIANSSLDNLRLLLLFLLLILALTTTKFRARPIVIRSRSYPNIAWPEPVDVTARPTTNSASRASRMVNKSQLRE
jgi:hypothetical protein